MKFTGVKVEVDVAPTLKGGISTLKKIITSNCAYSLLKVGAKRGHKTEIVEIIY